VSAKPLPPVVTLISPLAGPTSGGTVVTITGANLGTAATARVLFGSTPATILSDNGTTIEALSPPGLAGLVTVTVTTPGGTSAVSAADQFTYIGPPSLSQSGVTVASPSLQVGATTAVTLTVRDARGIQELGGGLAVTFALGSGSGKGTFGPVIDNHNGTYTAIFTGTAAGSNSILAFINGQLVTSTRPVLTIA
jgi:hypothetical protein